MCKPLLCVERRYERRVRPVVVSVILLGLQGQVRLLTDRGSVQASEVQSLAASAADALEERHVPSHTSSDRRA